MKYEVIESWAKSTIWLRIGAASGEGKKWVTIQRWAGSGLQEHIFKFRMSKCSDWPQTKKHHFWWFGSYNYHGCKSNDIYTPLGFTRVRSVLCMLSQDGRRKQIKWTLGAERQSCRFERTPRDGAAWIDMAGKEDVVPVRAGYRNSADWDRWDVASISNIEKSFTAYNSHCCSCHVFPNASDHWGWWMTL